MIYLTLKYLAVIAFILSTYRRMYLDNLAAYIGLFMCCLFVVSEELKAPKDYIYIGIIVYIFFILVYSIYKRYTRIKRLKENL